MEFTRTPDMILDALTQAAAAAGIDLPAALTEGKANIDAAEQRAVARLNDATALTRTAGALLDGKAPTATDVATLVAQANRGMLGRALETEASARRRALIRDQAPAILELLNTACAQASSTIAKALEAVPGLDLTVDSPRGVPTEHLTLWGQAREALARLVTLTQGGDALVDALGLPPVAHAHLPLRWADLDVDQLEALGSHRNVASLAAAGHAVSLARPAEVIARVERVEAAQAEREARRRAAAEKRMSDAPKVLLGF